MLTPLKKHHIVLVLFILCTKLQIYSQTIGLVYHDTEVSDGYTLFTPSFNNKVYLVNNCGETVNEWTFNEQPGLTCYLLENGNLLRAGKNHLETRDWDNNIVWSFDMEAAGYKQHHDIEPLPNGNILCILNDRYSSSEMIAAGKNPSFVNNQVKIDKIIELQPVGTNNAVIVWEWKFMDHLIQDHDNTKLNFGAIIDHPELFDINFNNLNTDITHVNGIDYNSGLDQIILSARHMNELYIIDHSTTTLEAANHSGGNANKGGDFLWRWGNPLAYKQGTTLNQKLFLQHDAKWVETGYTDEGKISVFNNDGDGSASFSSVHLISPDIVNNIYQKENNIFKPSTYEWSWQGSILGTVVNEGRKSGAHSLPNGNFIITETSQGRVSEIKKNGTLIWSYINPSVSGTNILNQFEIATSENNIFRGEKYPSDYIGFFGKNLTPNGIIENQNSISNNCINQLNIGEIELKTVLVQNPIQENKIQFNQIIDLDAATIIDLNGRVVSKFFNIKSNHITIKLESSIYLLKLQKGNSIKFLKVINH